MSHILSYDFDLPVDEVVRVRLFDIRGRLVSGLLEQRLAAGRYHFTWKRTGASSSGVYFLRADAGRAHRSRKIVLLGTGASSSR